MQPSRRYRMGFPPPFLVEWRPIRRAFGSGTRTHYPSTDKGRDVMPVIARRLAITSTALVLLAATTSGVLAQKKYDTGATDTSAVEVIANRLAITGITSLP